VYMHSPIVVVQVHSTWKWKPR